MGQQETVHLNKAFIMKKRYYRHPFITQKRSLITL